MAGTYKTYDEQCLELAKHFLLDYKFDRDEERDHFAHRLAGVIQSTVEEWLSDYVPEANRK